MRGILESAAVDPEQLPPPKDIWFDDEELERWYKGRRELMKAGLEQV